MVVLLSCLYLISVDQPLKKHQQNLVVRHTDDFFDTDIRFRWTMYDFFIATPIVTNNTQRNNLYMLYTSNKTLTHLTKLNPLKKKCLDQHQPYLNQCFHLQDWINMHFQIYFQFN